MAEYLGEGIYKIGRAERIWSCRKAVLENSVAKVSPDCPPADANFGWLKGAIPTPPSGGFYVVEFLDAQKVRVLGYVDMYGRAFRTEEGFERPPAEQDALFIAKTDDVSNNGAIFVREEDGSTIRCASYSVKGSGQNAKYTIEDTWYDFADNASNLHYYDLMSRAYLAFVYRPTLGTATVPFGIADVESTLTTRSAVEAFAKIVDRMNAIDSDSQVIAHPAVTKLRDRLVECEAKALIEDPNAKDALRLARTDAYAHTYYLSRSDDSASISEKELWELEAALNLFALSTDTLKVLSDKGEAASVDAIEQHLLEMAADQTLGTDIVSQFPQGAEDGEWQTRSKLASAIENMALPIRVEARFFIDLPRSLAAVKMTVPSAEMFEDLNLSQGNASRAAESYAKRIGLMLADAAFKSSPRIAIVNVVAEPLEEEDEKPSSGTPINSSDNVGFSATFDRTTWDQTNGFSIERSGDPSSLYQRAESAFDAMMSADQSGFAQDGMTQAFPDLMKDLEASLEPSAAAAFAASTRRGIQIDYASDMRTLAEYVADAISTSENATDAVQAIRQVQDALRAKGVRSQAVDDAFKRILTSVAEDTLDVREQNATVEAFLEEDKCLQAYRKAKTLIDAGDTEAGEKVLVEAIDSTDLSWRYTDTETVVYRAFDSYVSRLTYNLMKAGSDQFLRDSSANTDAGKTTKLIPDSYYLCLLELADLLDGSFNKSDEAMKIANRAIKIAPTIGTGYRILARAYMLVGDMTMAAKTLNDGLKIMFHPEDIATAYYQLAYILWKSEKPELGLACYMRSMMTSPVLTSVCLSEMNELQEATGMTAPEIGDVDRILAENDITIAPTDALLDAISNAAIAALDEGLYKIARSLLTVVFTYRPDDAVVGVLRSLEDRMFS